MFLYLKTVYLNLDEGEQQHINRAIILNSDSHNTTWFNWTALQGTSQDYQGIERLNFGLRVYMTTFSWLLFLHQQPDQLNSIKKLSILDNPLAKVNWRW